MAFFVLVTLLMYYTYVLYSEAHNRFYIGMCGDVEKRLTEHNNGKTKSTKGYRPWIIVFTEEHETRIKARERDVYLKPSIGREYIRQYLEKKHSRNL